MAAFWWYVPGESKQTLAADDRLSRIVLRRHGLERVLEDVRIVPDQCLLVELPRGPDDGKGVLLYPLPVSNDVPRRAGFHPESQQWKQTPAGPWLGYDPGSPPEPCDLERRTLVGGYRITDAHDRPWHVPVLRAVDNPRGRLSAAFGWDADDQPTIGVDPRYADLWERSAEVWDLIDQNSQDAGAVFAQDFDEATDQRLLAFVLDSLRINYRVNNSVFAALDRIRPGWLSQSTASWMLNATVDLFKYRAFLAAQKKTPSS